MSSHMLRSLARSWREHTGTQIATLVVLTGTFTIVALFLFAQANFVKILTRWGDNVQFAVFLEDAASQDQVSAVKAFLENSGRFKSVDFVSKEKAAETFRQQMGNNSPELLRDPEFGNPLPASFEARLLEGVDSKSSYDVLVDLAGRVISLPGVNDVSYGQGWVENYASLLKVFATSSWILLSVLLAGSLLIVGNAIRAAVQGRRDEIEILELFGATSWYVRGPLIVEGALIGLFASILSIGLCFALFQWQQKIAEENLGFWGLAKEVGFLSGTQIAIVLLLGLGFGALGSYLSVRRIATGWAAAERI